MTMDISILQTPVWGTVFLTIWFSLMNRLRGSGYFPMSKIAAWLGFTAGFIAVLGQEPIMVFTAVVFFGLMYWDFTASWGWTLDDNRRQEDTQYGGLWDISDKRWQEFPAKQILAITGYNNDYFGHFLRRLFILPLMLGIVYYQNIPMPGIITPLWVQWMTFDVVIFTVAHAALMSSSYWLGWRITDVFMIKDGIRQGELVSGAAYGFLVSYLLLWHT